MRLLSSVGLVGTGLVAMAAGCHLIVGIRDAELYEVDAGVTPTDCTPEQVQACYGGAEQTEGVGSCKAGTQTCSTEGAWGPCEGEMLPREEDCSKPEDEDCNGSVCGETLWVKQFGGDTWITDVTVDPRNGDIYVAGSFVGPLTIGAVTLDSGSYAGVALLAKFDKQGTPLWAKQLGKINASWEDNEGAHASSVAIDGQGNVVVVGNASPTINLGFGELPQGIFIGKFSQSGEPIWGKVCQSNYADARGVVDPTTNDVVLVGDFGSSANSTIECGSSIFSSDAADIFIARLAANDGVAMTMDHFGGPGSDQAADVAIDAHGSIFLIGSAQTGFNFGGGATVAGSFVVKLASNSSPVWSKAVGQGSMRSMALDATGGPALTGSGYSADPLNFGGNDLLQLGDSYFDLFVAKLDAVGDHGWSKRYESHAVEDVCGSSGADIAIDSKGRMAVIGWLSRGNVTIDNVVLAGDDDSFLVQFDSTGTTAWSKMLGTPREHRLAFSPLDEIVVAGRLKTPMDFGTGLITPIGQRDFILLKIAP